MVQKCAREALSVSLRTEQQILLRADHSDRIQTLSRTVSVSPTSSVFLPSRPGRDAVEEGRRLTLQEIARISVDEAFRRLQSQLPIGRLS